MHARAFPVHSIAANSPKRKNCILLAYVTGTTRPIGKYFRCDVFRTNFYWGLNNTLKKMKKGDQRKTNTAEQRGAQKARQRSLQTTLGMRRKPLRVQVSFNACAHTRVHVKNFLTSEQPCRERAGGRGLMALHWRVSTGHERERVQGCTGGPSLCP